MLYPVLKANAAKYGDKVALQIKRDGQYVRYTYAQVLDWACRFAFRLRNMGIGPQDHVGLWAESVPEWGLAYLGIHFAGAVVVPLDYQYQQEVVTSLLKFAGAKALVCAGERLGEAENVARELNLQVLTLDSGGERFSPLKTPDDFHPHSYNPDDTMSLIFTSGTTGDPKGVMLSCQNLLSNAKAVIAEQWTSDEDVFICVLPLHHSYAFTGTFMTPILSGCTVTYQPVLKGPEILTAIRETGVTIMLGVPQLFNGFAQAIQDAIARQPWLKRAIFKALYSIARKGREWFNWNLGRRCFRFIHSRFGDSFRCFVSGGAKADRAVAAFFWNIGIPMLEGYGLTETSPVITCTPIGRYFPGSVGPCLKGTEVRIDNPNSEGIGEIVMRGPGLMKGYYKNQIATDEVVKDGWFYTGDLGYLDKNRFLYITGRAKEVIVLDSGKNVYPEEVERHYESDPLVKEVCVLGKKEEDGRIKSLCALVVPDMEEVQRQKLNSIHTEVKFRLENLSLKLPTYMRVNSFKIVSEPFPRTRLGKLKRNLIESRLSGEEEKEEIRPEELSKEDILLLSNPVSEKFLTRLQKLLQCERQILPGDSLELDLGLSSIKRMELLVILEQEFGVKISQEEGNALLYVRDALKCLPSEAGEATSAAFSWTSFLRQGKKPSLDEMFHLQRGRGKNFLIEIVRWLGRIFCKICFGLKIEGFSRIEKYHGACLIAPTHQSYLDAVLIYCSLPKATLHRTAFIGLDQMFSKPPLSWLVRPARIIRTASSYTALSSLQYAAQALKKGMCVCIFPEGQRSIDGTLNPPMVGAGILSCECHVPMFPIVIKGAMATYSRIHPGFHFASMELTMLDPIFPPDKENFEEEDYRKSVNIWYQKADEREASK